MPRPGHSTTRKEPVPIVQEAVWAPVPVWTGAVNLAQTGIRFPDRPARSESLYRRSHPGSQLPWVPKWSVLFSICNEVLYVFITDPGRAVPSHWTWTPYTWWFPFSTTGKFCNTNMVNDKTSTVYKLEIMSHSNVTSTSGNHSMWLGPDTSFPCGR